MGSEQSVIRMSGGLSKHLLTSYWHGYQRPSTRKVAGEFNMIKSKGLRKCLRIYTGKVNLDDSYQRYIPAVVWVFLVDEPTQLIIL